jgi:two-component sensor histidine kinase
MANSAGSRGIRLLTESEPVAVSLDLAVPLGLTLNELVTNSLKHGFAGRSSGQILVRLRRLEGQRVRLEVSDDGIGLGAAEAAGSTGALGLQLVESLARQLDAELGMSSDNGARTWLEFDAPAERSLNL